MRRLLIAVPLVALSLFAAGYLIGQVRSVTSGFAASNGPVVLDTGAYGSANPVRPAASVRGAAGTRHADGTVTAVNGNTITIKAGNDAGNPNEYTGVTTIALTSSTQYNLTGGKSAIKVGSRIVAEGSVSSDGRTLTATQISAGGARGCPHGAPRSSPTPSTSSSPNI